MLRRCAAFAVVLLASAALLSPWAARAWLAKSGEEPVVIGKIVEGTGVVRYAE